MRLRLVLALLAVAVLLVCGDARAHKPSDSYLTLRFAGRQVDVRWDIALRDLDYAIGLDGDGDGAITWGEVRAGRERLARYAMDRLAIRAGGEPPCVAPSLGDLGVVSHSDGTYAVLHFTLGCEREPGAIDVDYELFFDVDPLHRGIARIDDGAGTRTAIFSAADRRQSFDGTTTAPMKQLLAAIKLGVTHIFEGVDHLLFLVALLLPSVLAPRGARGWEPVPRLRPALVDVLKIVTAFTLAHSITLTLSALEVLRLPSRLVESGIAASVVLAALNNVWPVLRGERWAAAFALGLLHGFGFSATLMDMGLPRQNLVLTLFGFNLGVEIGQACVVAAFVPLAFLARGTRGYRRGALVGGSMVIAAVAGVWLVERAFAVKIF